MVLFTGEGGGAAPPPPTTSDCEVSPDTVGGGNLVTLCREEVHSLPGLVGH